MYKNVEEHLLQSGVARRLLSLFQINASEPLHPAVWRLLFGTLASPQLSLSCQEVVTHSRSETHSPDCSARMREGRQVGQLTGPTEQRAAQTLTRIPAGPEVQPLGLGPPTATSIRQ